MSRWTTTRETLWVHILPDQPRLHSRLRGDTFEKSSGSTLLYFQRWILLCLDGGDRKVQRRLRRRVIKHPRSLIVYRITNINPQCLVGGFINVTSTFKSLLSASHLMVTDLPSVHQRRPTPPSLVVNTAHTFTPVRCRCTGSKLLVLEVRDVQFCKKQAVMVPVQGSWTRNQQLWNCRTSTCWERKTVGVVCEATLEVDENGLFLIHKRRDKS